LDRFGHDRAGRDRGSDYTIVTTDMCTTTDMGGAITTIIVIMIIGMDHGSHDRSRGHHE